MQRLKKLYSGLVVIDQNATARVKARHHDTLASLTNLWREGYRNLAAAILGKFRKMLKGAIEVTCSQDALRTQKTIDGILVAFQHLGSTGLPSLEQASLSISPADFRESYVKVREELACVTHDLVKLAAVIVKPSVDINDGDLQISLRVFEESKISQFARAAANNFKQAPHTWCQ